MTKSKPGIIKIVELERNVRFWERRVNKYQAKIDSAKKELKKLLQGWKK